MIPESDRSFIADIEIRFYRVLGKDRISLPLNAARAESFCISRHYSWLRNRYL